MVRTRCSRTSIKIHLRTIPKNAGLDYVVVAGNSVALSSLGAIEDSARWNGDSESEVKFRLCPTEVQDHKDPIGDQYRVAEKKWFQRSLLRENDSFS